MMKIIAILLGLTGLSGIGLGMLMHGDIAIASMVGGASGLLSGIGFLKMASLTASTTN